MSKDKIYLFDTTLRDGAQTEGVDFSLEDKNKIAKVLSDIGVDYIEDKIEERIKAKKSGNYDLADKIREELLNAGILIEDEKGKTKWRYK